MPCKYAGGRHMYYFDPLGPEQDADSMHMS